MKARTAVLLVGGALALGLGACGGGGSSDSSADTSASPSTTQEGSTEASTTSNADLTPPGTKLKAGETATVGWEPEFNPGKPGTKLAITVESIKKGSIDELSDFDLESKYKTATPFYVSAKIEALEEIPASQTEEPGISLAGIDDRGQEQSSLTILSGEFAPCEENEAPKPLKAGESYETCSIYLIPGGGSLTEEQWNSGPVSSDGLDEYFDEPIVWSGS